MATIISRLNQIDYKKLIWVMAIAETIHNLEEAIWLPAVSQAAGVGPLAVGAFEFRFAVTIVTLVFYGIIYYFSRYDHQAAKYLMAGLLVMTLFNVFMPHLIGTMITGRYAPGVISGILLNVPVCLYLLWRGLKDGVYKTSTLVFGSLVLALITLPLLVVSFALGRFFESIL